MNTVYIKDLGSFYRISPEGNLEFSPASAEGEPDDEFYEVEEHLVGDEIVTFDGDAITLSEAYFLIRKQLEAE
jgi:hypothetical protein